MYKCKRDDTRVRAVCGDKGGQAKKGWVVGGRCIKKMHPSIHPSRHYIDVTLDLCKIH